MFYVRYERRSPQFKTIREAVMHFESIKTDAIVSTASDYVYQIRRDGVVYRVDELVRIKDEWQDNPLEGLTPTGS